MTGESSNQGRIRDALSAQGYRLFRNNVGVLPDKRGVPVRFGLANDSAAVNRTLKSSDLIGWRPVVITPDMVGQTIAQFVSIECKEDGWRFRATDERAVAQRRWIDMVVREGGAGGFMIDLAKGWEKI